MHLCLFQTDEHQNDRITMFYLRLDYNIKMFDVYNQRFEFYGTKETYK